MKTLIVCDLQPDVTQKLPEPQRTLFLDLVQLAVSAAHKSSQPNKSAIIYTLLQFEPGYEKVPVSHPRLGILRKLAAKNPNLNWFTTSKLSIPQADGDHDTVIPRSTFLPQANDQKLLDVLKGCCCGETTGTFTLLGYGPTVQAMSNILGDVLAIPNVQILQECVWDENEDRCQAFLNHGLLFQEQLVPMVDFLESVDALHEVICTRETNTNIKYVSDCGRGGHLSLFMPYLLRDYGYTLWPIQPWYQELTLTVKKEYYCPLGRRVVDLCDEPQFGRGTRFFLSGRQFLDEKDLLHQLAPELMPDTFLSVEEARKYADEHVQENENSCSTKLVWFLKKVNQNGGRAVSVINELPRRPLEADEQIQIHVPRPLLYHENHERSGKFKCHIKTYQYLACCHRHSGSAETQHSAKDVEWQLYMHDLYYLATANNQWSPEDLSDDAQITTMRTHRIYPDNPWRVQWQLSDLCRANMTTVIKRAVEQGKLQAQHPTTGTVNTCKTESTKERSTNPAAALQFEVNSADWMLDEDGRMYLIEINGIPVLYDAGTPQELCTRGLKLYDRLYKESPETAVVNDHDLLQEALGLALTGKVPDTSLWKRIATFAPPEHAEALA